jgi:hypothetical protein
LWENCWSAARFHLGLTDREFGELTPRQFALLMDRHREKVDLDKTLAGIVASAVANFGYCRPKEALQPADFVGGPRQKKPRVSKKQQTQNLRAFFMARIKK